MVVAQPAANASPATIGQHVGLAETNIASIQKNLSDNLGISVHALVDAGYEHNFNQPIRQHQRDTRVGPGRISAHAGQPAHRARWDGRIRDRPQLRSGRERDFLGHALLELSARSVRQWFDPTQYYLTYTAPIGSGISFEAGRFVTLLGAEIIPVYNNQNFNESRGLLFNLGEPLTHTGIRASYTFNDYVSATAGLNNGWDDPASQLRTAVRTTRVS